MSAIKYYRLARVLMSICHGRQKLLSVGPVSEGA